MKTPRKRQGFTGYIRKTAPGLITGGADNDPAGISTYSVAGASYGYQQLWVMVLATPLLIAVQSMCARLGDVTKKGLARLMREHFPKPVAILAVVILVVANIATIGADLAGMGAAMELVTGIPLWAWIVPFGLLIWYIIVFKSYRTVQRMLLWLILAFLAYIVSAILAHPDWSDVLKNLVVPSIHFTPGYFAAAVGLLGTTITPYLFFWQTKEEIEEHHRVQDAKHEDRNLMPGFIFSNLISVFIMIATGAVLFSNGHDIHTAADAAQALEPLAGRAASLLFAVGLVGAGLLAIPVLAASTAYVVADNLGWKNSLNDTVHHERGFYAVLTSAIFVGAIIALSGVDPISALFYSQVVVGVMAPFLVILIIKLSNSRKVMGEYVSGWFDNVFGWLAVAVMAAASLGMFLS